MYDLLLLRYVVSLIAQEGADLLFDNFLVYGAMRQWNPAVLKKFVCSYIGRDLHCYAVYSKRKTDLL